MRGVTHIALSTAVALLVAAGAAAGSPPERAPQHVTLIGDSVADAIAGDPRATAILSQGLRLELQVAPCRRVDQPSCTVAGVQPPNVVQLVAQLGHVLGPNVIVAVGYNDFAARYAQNIRTALAALKAAGVRRVWWLTLRAAEHPYLGMNREIEAAARTHSSVAVIDWNRYSRSHPGWFRADGLHLLPVGAEAMATLIHKRLVASRVAAPPLEIAIRILPPGRRGRPYAARIRTAGGVAPLRFTLLTRAPAGLRLRASAVVGTPRRPGVYRVEVQVDDSSGYSTTRTLALRVLK